MAEEVTIELDKRGNFTYRPSTFHLFNIAWKRRNVVWKCAHPFCVDFGERSLFKHFRYPSTKKGKDHRTREAKLHSAGVAGLYKYRVFVYRDNDDRIFVDDCPGGGCSGDKC